MSIRKAFFSSTEVVPARDAIGRVSADTLSAYPPGIPNLMAGEVITPSSPPNAYRPVKPSDSRRSQAMRRVPRHRRSDCIRP